MLAATHPAKMRVNIRTEIAVGNRENYALLGLFMGLLFGGLVGAMLYLATRQSGFLWLPAVGAGIGLWLGTLADRGQSRQR
jgi:hypothetical protein